MVLVTGATGLLGRVLVLDLLKQGRTVRATKRHTSNLDDVRKSFRFYTNQPDFYFNQIEWVEVDFEDQDRLQEVLQGVTEVYHTAAFVSFHPKYKRLMYRSNIQGTRNLLYACEQSTVQKFCFISSMSVLDGANEQGFITEDSNYNPKEAHSAYASSKHFSEMEVWRASAEGMQTVIVNPGVIIGSGNWQSSSGTLFDRLRKMPLVPPGSVTYVDVRDVSRICIELMNQNDSGERYILVSETVPFPEVAALVRTCIGKKPAGILPKWVLYAGYILNLLLGWLIPALRMLNKVNLESITGTRIVSNVKIRERLNTSFIPVRESLEFHLNNYLSDHPEL
ncbi:NAD-dependent epimerase/dehydratase family protein [Chryseobacterium salipaludis]|uniref:NAD-dependent epimerase/dehydratase family protein n=1 Tax=Chryseobacterium TaxID=59732 RepID=UPI001FF61D6E|nr:MULTISPECIES: NAD-dependent epimerase/dehydratase family protein [Chryseobacterium]MCJ8497104.1 NAD-dependent epimerase/dehydratase family protein [Chryseobacterium salipaludis]MCX3296585.1 NAD-dependent epimerase/dehydratase family protein [Planobacterium sp. JC490]